MAQMDLGPGTLIASSVRLVRLLGEGGMGSVWVADHLRLETQVAVKFVDPLLVKKHPDMRARFKREATAAAKIDSPHVVRTFDQGEMSDGTPFIVMEMLKGESLADRIDRAGPLSPKDTAIVIGQLCKVLRLAHKLGIVHRDIKPHNLFLCGAPAGTSEDDPAHDELFVKVLDFGIAKVTTAPGSFATTTGAMLGTPGYMSPEQILSAKETDLRADLWATAVVAYECLTGKLPFAGDTMGAIMHAVVSGRFTPPSEALRSVPAAFDAWFARALALDIERRFSAARELAESFAGVVGGLGFSIDDPLSASVEIGVASTLAADRAALPQTAPRVPPNEPVAQAVTAANWAGTAPGAAAAPRSSRRGMWSGVGLLAVAAIGAAAFVFVPRPVAPAATATATSTTTTTATSTTTTTATSTATTTATPALTTIESRIETASATTSPTTTTAAPVSNAEPRPAASAKPAPKKKPADCATSPQYVGADGKLHWRTECL